MEFGDCVGGENTDSPPTTDPGGPQRLTDGGQSTFLRIFTGLIKLAPKLLCLLRSNPCVGSRRHGCPAAP